jgi:hypothetical protein
MKINLSIFFFIAFSLNIFAQEILNLSELETEINALAEEMHKDSAESRRLKNANDILTLLSNNLIQKGSFKYPFSNLKGISVLEPKDKKFKIFTWEVFVNKDSYRQFGIIQTADEKVYALEDKSETIKAAEFAKLKPENWYGALYYHVQDFTTGVNNETQYLLLGRDSYGYYERRKVIDILYFDFMGRPRFGNNLIQIKDGRGQLRTVGRYFLQYSAVASVMLRYDQDLKMVIYDHLVMGSPIMKDVPPSNIPDGSFNGLKTQKGKWEFVDMVFEYNPDNILEDAQNPAAIMLRNDQKRDGGKDIFGKEKSPEKKKNLKTERP